MEFYYCRKAASKENQEAGNYTDADQVVGPVDHKLSIQEKAILGYGTSPTKWIELIPFKEATPIPADSEDNFNNLQLAVRAGIDFKNRLTKAEAKLTALEALAKQMANSIDGYLIFKKQYAAGFYNDQVSTGRAVDMANDLRTSMEISLEAYKREINE